MVSGSAAALEKTFHLMPVEFKENILINFGSLSLQIYLKLYTIRNMPVKSKPSYGTEPNFFAIAKRDFLT